MPKISVIVPAYNVEPYIEEAVNSILSQTLNDLEVIVVDDAGTDCTLEKVKKLAENDSRIRIINHSVNKGLSAARNSGIVNSRGKYIALLDGDDLFASNNVLEKLYEHIKIYDSDMIRSQLAYYSEKEDQIVQDHQGVRDFGLTIYNTDILNFPVLQNHKTSWLFMYKKNFLEQKKIKFCEFLKRREDMAFVYDCLLRTRKVSICPKVSHLYRQRAAQNAITDNPDLADLTFFINQIKHIFSIRMQNNIVFYSSELDSIFRGIVARYIGVIDKVWIPVARNFNKEDQSYFLETLIDAFSVYNYTEFDFSDWSFLDALDQLKLRSGYYALFLTLISSGDFADLFKLLNNKMMFSDLVSICAKQGLASSSTEQLEKQLFKKLDTTIKKSKTATISFPLAPKEVIETKIPLYIHIGSTKTGTTSIQNWLYDNRFANYRDTGIYFPYTGITFDPVRNDRMSGHHNLFVSLFKGGALLGKLYEELISLDPLPSKIILSCENLTYGDIWLDEKNIQMIKHAFSCFDVRIVYYVRPQHEWLNSMYGEAVCGGWQMYSRSCMDFYLREKMIGRTNYYRIASLWSRAFGNEKIVVNCFNREALPEGVVNNFLDSIDVTSLRSPRSFSSNVSLGDSFISTVRLTNLFDMPLKQHQEFVAEFEERYIADKLKDYHSDFYSPGQKKIIVQDHDKSNALLAKEYLDGGEIWENTLKDTRPNEAPARNINEKILNCGLKIFIKKFKGLAPNTGTSEHEIVESSQVKVQEHNKYSHYKSWPLLKLLIKIECFFRTKLQVRIIKKSQLFDIDWYLNKYPDVKESRIDPVKQYLIVGAAEGRDPSPDFSTSIYLQERPDVRERGINPLFHYVRHGMQGR